MKAIIFGISGQDGYYLEQILAQNGIRVAGVSRSGGNWLKGSVTDFGFVQALVREQQPDYIFHLAANSVTRHDAIFENHETISTGTINVLEAAYRHSRHSKVFLSGSALQLRNEGSPISEKNEFDATSPYAVARIQSVYAARYFRKLGIQAYVGYFFNHDSPLRSEKHINKLIADAVLRMKSGSDEIIEIGNWNVKKEFNYAGDFMQAIWMLVNQQAVSEAVIGSGRAYSIKEWIDICCEEAGIPTATRQFVQKETYTPEYDILVSDPRVIFSLGWKPEVDIHELARLMLK